MPKKQKEELSHHEEATAILENVFGASLEISPNIEEPVAKTKKPAQVTEELVAKAKKPKAEKKKKAAKPVVVSKVATGEIEEPAAKTEVPVAKVEETVVVTEEEPAIEEPVAETKEQVVEPVEETVVETNRVVAETSAPIAATTQEPTDSPITKASKPKKKKKAKPAQVEPTAAEQPATEQTTNEPEAESESGPKFSDLALSEEVQLAVKKTGYERPTPIQAEIIPHLLYGRDVLAQSQTGTGKTAAFALPILTRIETECKEPQVLVLVPTRELAIQVANSFGTYGSQLPGFNHAVIYGGQDYEIQYRQLRKGPQVVVGTPGRTIDHIKNGKLDISEIECLVLDEADEMLNMGFLDDVKFVLDRAPDDRQIALFSATLPDPIRKISQRYLTDPAKVTIKRKTLTADSIRQRAVFVAPRDRVDMLTRFLEAEEADAAIVFTRTRETTSVVADKLTRAGLRAVALNGEMPQKSRERTIQKLKSGDLDILVATDIAARGLDVPRISHVFNYDLPEGAEAYTHRIGRTGRAGKKGEAIIFATSSQRGKLKFIERMTRQEIEIVDPPSTDQINKMRIKRFHADIDKTIAERDMHFFEKLVNDFMEQSDHPVEKVAAAIAMMGQKDREFLMKDRPVRERSDKRKNGRKGNEGGGRFSGPPEPGMARFRLAVGKQDGVRPGNIVGAVTNEASIDGDDIGSIRIHHAYTTIDLPADRADEIIDRLSETRVSGRAIKIRPYEERSGHSGRDNSRKQYGNRRNNKSTRYSKPKRGSGPSGRGRSNDGGGSEGKYKSASGGAGAKRRGKHGSKPKASASRFKKTR